MKTKFNYMEYYSSTSSSSSAELYIITSQESYLGQIKR